MADTLFLVAAVIAGLAVVVVFARLVAGPTVADRAVSLDGMTIITISLIAYISLRAGRIIYLDVALVYALVSFLGVVALARYLERGL